MFSFSKEYRKGKQGKKNLKCEYCRIKGFDNECINFLIDNQFTYQYNTFMGKAFGSGIYQVRNNRIILNFRKDNSITSEFISVTDSSISKNDSIQIKVLVIDAKTKEQLPFMVFGLKTLDGKIIKGFMTDTSGKGIIQFPKTGKMVELLFNNMGYLLTSIVLKADKNYSLTVLATTPYGSRINEGVIMEFRIKEMNNEKLVLKRINRDSVYSDYNKIKK